MRRQQGRIARQGSARHSDTLSKSGSGDPRDHRREAQRLSDGDLDPTVLKIENGRLTLVAKAGAGSTVAPVVDQTSGTASHVIPELRDPVDLTAAPATATVLRDELVSTTLPAIRDALASIRNGLATLSSKVNAILEEAKG
jgi:hypothetical protein